MGRPIRILGIDPGLRRTGWGLIEVDGNRLIYVACGSVATSDKVSLAEVGLWIDGLVRFDFSRGLQFEQQRTWFSDLNVSYHVGFYGFSLWLAGLTVVVMACAIGYAVWAGR